MENGELELNPLVVGGTFLLTEVLTTQPGQAIINSFMELLKILKIPQQNCKLLSFLLPNVADKFYYYY